MKSNTIVYVGPYAFPSGGAAARRILGNCQALRDAGYDVIITSGQMQVDGPVDNEFGGFPVISLNERSFEHLPRFIRHFFYFFMGKKTVKWLDSLTNKPKAVVLYSGYSPYFLQLLPWVKRNNVRLIFDAVEWYDAPSKIKGWLSPYYLNIEYAMRYLSIKSRNVIVISRYLEAYYKAKGLQTVLVPPTLDIEKIEARTTVADAHELSLVYAGSPGNKDLFDNVLEAVLQVDKLGHEIKLHIAGITSEELLQYSAIRTRQITAVPDCLCPHGNVSHEQALELVRNADFSVFLRPNKRYAQAGFPTKFVESMTLGTPVITNITSDLKDYLEDRVDGLVSQSHEPVALKDQLLMALTLSVAELLQYRINARKKAVNSFDYRHFVSSLKRFIENAKPV